MPGLHYNQHLNNINETDMCSVTMAADSGVAYRYNVRCRLSKFLAERWNCIAKFAYCHGMLSVCPWRECIMTKRMKLGSRGFNFKVAKCLSF